MTLVVVGDALLDRDVTGRATRLAPDAPVPVVDVEAEHCRPGGAALAAALAARDGREVVLVTALGEDRASAELRALLPPGVRLAPLPLRGSLPVKSRVLAGGRPLLRTDHGGGTPGPPTPEVHAALASARAVLVADYGQGTVAALREVLAAAACRVPLVWDPHPRGGPPVPGARLATPNEREARHFCGQDRDGDESLAGHSARGSLLAARWNAATVAVTLGARGAVLTRADCDDPLYVPVSDTCDGDPCGAGDCFAATAATTLADGGLPPEAVARAVTAASTFVTAGGLAALTDLWNAPTLESHASTPTATPGLVAAGPLRAPTAPANGAAQDAYGGAAAGPIAAQDLHLPPAAGARTAPDPAPPDAAGARTAPDREGPDAAGARTAPDREGPDAAGARTAPVRAGPDAAGAR
ncbi:PfkB family carbohydrate kinase, partial [Streptomyces sp. DSM 44917]